MTHLGACHIGNAPLLFQSLTLRFCNLGMGMGPELPSREFKTFFSKLQQNGVRWEGDVPRGSHPGVLWISVPPPGFGFYPTLLGKDRRWALGCLESARDE